MNTRNKIRTAIDDLNNGGFIKFVSCYRDRHHEP